MQNSKWYQGAVLIVLAFIFLMFLITDTPANPLLTGQTPETHLEPWENEEDHVSQYGVGRVVFTILDSNDNPLSGLYIWANRFLGDSEPALPGPPDIVSETTILGKYQILAIERDYTIFVYDPITKIKESYDVTEISKHFGGNYTLYFPKKTYTTKDVAVQTVDLTIGIKPEPESGGCFLSIMK